MMPCHSNKSGLKRSFPGSVIARPDKLKGLNGGRSHRRPSRSRQAGQVHRWQGPRRCTRGMLMKGLGLRHELPGRLKCRSSHIDMTVAHMSAQGILRHCSFGLFALSHPYSAPRRDLNRSGARQCLIHAGQPSAIFRHKHRNLQEDCPVLTADALQRVGVGKAEAQNDKRTRPRGCEELVEAGPQNERPPTLVKSGLGQPNKQQTPVWHRWSTSHPSIHGLPRREQQGSAKALS